MDSWTKQETYKFIQLYKSEPILWNSQRPKNIKMVHNAWDKISAAMKKPIPLLHLKSEELKKEFSIHFKRVQSLLRAGANYKTFAFFDTKQGFAEMYNFLKEVYDFNNTISPNIWDHETSSEDEDSNTLNDENASNAEPPKKKAKMDSESDDDEINEDFHENLLSAFKLLQNLLQLKLKRMEKTEDECELYGKLIAAKLRRFPELERQEIIREIDDMIFQKLCNVINSDVQTDSHDVKTESCDSDNTKFNETDSENTKFNETDSEIGNEIKIEPTDDLIEIEE